MTLSEAAEKLHRARLLAAQARREEDAAKKALEAHFAEAEVTEATEGRWIIRRCLETQRRLDQKALREARPEIVEAFSVEAEVVKWRLEEIIEPEPAA